MRHNQHRRPTRRARTTGVRVAVLAVMAGVASVGVGGTAHAAVAAPKPPPDAASLPPQSVAVVSPTMKAMLWGDTVFVNIGCEVMTSYAASTMEALKLSGSGQFADATTDGCGQFASAGGDLIIQGMSAVQPLAAVNTYLNPGIQGFADAVRGFGQTYDEGLTPFGPTVSSFGNSIEFFKGSDPKP
jgi:hypothetical protein